MVDLSDAGYCEKERLTILNAGITTLTNIKKLEDSGKRPFYRNEEFKLKNPNHKKQDKNQWFKNDSAQSAFASVMFVEATPDDKLIKMLRETESRLRISDKSRIKFVSKTGVKIVNLLQRKDPFEGNCKSDYKACEFAKKKGKLSHGHRSGV